MSLLLKKKIAKQFNQAVATYDRHALVQRKMAEQLVKLLPRSEEKLRILEIGCGTGIFTHLLVQAFSNSTIVAVDIAEEMVNKARSLLNQAKNIQFVVGDIEALDLSKFAPFDFIVSNATIQWFQDKPKTIQKLSRVLSPNGWMITSTFGPQTFRELSDVFRRKEEELGFPSTLHHLPLLALDDWKQIWKQAGLENVDGIEQFHRLEYPDCYTFLKAVKAVGASYSENRLRLSQSRKLLGQVMRMYDQIYQVANGVYATYHILYVTGQKE
ncbi:malonyl-ACP O-methyltransferase BioC [Thermoflavimicrobium dichotomicum]|uniref:Malonyl-[acyl-carrier protein] O-methyltransferase n=1 Tax=Thermoflavimicrobium dichotomicum TaxID=46223 RepID=A0A1I3PYF5_9BACL|nr:malonyl-ACP O-methyltransferase BioC [Thermoflavimicrobium dichotomicum]SFJ26450.1 malonyl-CoA O-methyltransferase [Thermoflavimicrobium dichotomicum]